MNNFKANNFSAYLKNHLQKQFQMKFIIVNGCYVKVKRSLVFQIMLIMRLID